MGLPLNKFLHRNKESYTAYAANWEVFPLITDSGVKYFLYPCDKPFHSVSATNDLLRDRKEITAEKLLKEFKTLDNTFKASEEELNKILKGKSSFFKNLLLDK